MEKNTGTTFKVYLLGNQNPPSKQQGFIQLWKHKGELQGGKAIPFDYLDELPRRIRQELKKASIDWPQRKSK